MPNRNYSVEIATGSHTSALAMTNNMVEIATGRHTSALAKDFFD